MEKVTQDLNSFLDSLVGIGDNLPTIQSFLANPDNKVDVDGVVKILAAANLTDESLKASIIKYFLENPNNQNNKLTVEEFNDFLTTVNITN